MPENTALALKENEMRTEENDQNVSDMFVAVYPLFASLTNLQQGVLIRLIRNIASETVQTDAEMAAELGIHPKSIQYCRNHPVFTRLLATITIDVVRGNIDRIVNDAFKASRDGKVSAMELLLKYSGELIDKMAVLHARTGDDMQQVRTPVDALGKICKQFNKIGYTKDRLIDELTEIWDTLDAEGGL